MNPGLHPKVIRFGVFELDLRSGELYKAGHRIKIEAQPSKVLIILLETPGEVVSRQALKERLWPHDTFVNFDHSLNVDIQRLRVALGDSAENPRFIETLPRRGYRFIYPLDRSEGPAPAPAKKSNTTGWVKWGGVTAAFVLVMAAGYSFGKRDRVETRMPPSAVL